MARAASELASELGAGPVRLKFRHVVNGDPTRGLAPAYHFRVLNERGHDVGHINLRLGESSHVLLTAGHVGFEVSPRHRGSSYAYYACQALSPFARRHYDRVVLTTDPDNAASKRTIEKLGAKFIEEINVSPEDPAYVRGARRKRRYEWSLADSEP